MFLTIKSSIVWLWQSFLFSFFPCFGLTKIFLKMFPLVHYKMFVDDLLDSSFFFMSSFFYFTIDSTIVSFQFTKWISSITIHDSHGDFFPCFSLTKIFLTMFSIKTFHSQFLTIASTVASFSCSCSMFQFDKKIFKEIFPFTIDSKEVSSDKHNF